MKMIIAAVGLLAATPAFAQNYNNYGTGSNYRNNYVQPHVRSNGGYVGGHYRTNPNNSQSDNYGARGNYNPYTGQSGRGYGSRGNRY